VDLGPRVGVCTIVVSELDSVCILQAENKSFLSVAEKRGEIFSHAAEKKR
jgi:hypothetical protein